MEDKIIAAATAAARNRSFVLIFTFWKQNLGSQLAVGDQFVAATTGEGDVVVET